MISAIYTQTQEIIFCDKIIKILPISGMVENTPCYAIYAITVEVMGKTFDDEDISEIGEQLGVYDSEERAFEVLSEIKKFISSGIQGLFEMPVDIKE